MVLIKVAGIPAEIWVESPFSTSGRAFSGPPISLREPFLDARVVLAFEGTRTITPAPPQLALEPSTPVTDLPRLRAFPLAPGRISRAPIPPEGPRPASGWVA